MSFGTKRKLNALSLKRVFETVPASVPKTDETRRRIIWRHLLRDASENWVQLERRDGRIEATEWE